VDLALHDGVPEVDVRTVYVEWVCRSGPRCCTAADEAVPGVGRVVAESGKGAIVRRGGPRRKQDDEEVIAVGCHMGLVDRVREAAHELTVGQVAGGTPDVVGQPLAERAPLDSIFGLATVEGRRAGELLPGVRDRAGLGGVVRAPEQEI